MKKIYNISAGNQTTQNIYINILCERSTVPFNHCREKERESPLISVVFSASIQQILIASETKETKLNTRAL